MVSGVTVSGVTLGQWGNAPYFLSQNKQNDEGQGQSLCLVRNI
jgi:hypothetical protein